MTIDTKHAILDAAQPMVQAYGYNALSFRDVAAAIGVKSSSIHYHFPTKGDLGAALARRYTETGVSYLEGLRASSANPKDLVARFADIFRAALASDNRMCLVGIMAAEHGDLPPEVRSEVARFSEVCIDWLCEVLSIESLDGNVDELRSRASAIFAAIQGAQLVARGRDDLALYDQLVLAFRVNGLIP